MTKHIVDVWRFAYCNQFKIILRFVDRIIIFNIVVKIVVITKFKRKIDCTYCSFENPAIRRTRLDRTMLPTEGRRLANVRSISKYSWIFAELRFDSDGVVVVPPKWLLLCSAAGLPIMSSLLKQDIPYDAVDEYLVLLKLWLIYFDFWALKCFW